MSHAQEPKLCKPMHATGMLADDPDDCIDLVSQPEHDAPQPEHSHLSEHNRRPAYQLPADSGQATAYQQAATDTDTDKGVAEEIVDDKPEELLMECSTNLLNPGIRVHKYSIAFLLHFSSLQTTCDAQKAATVCLVCFLLSILMQDHGGNFLC